MIKEGKYGSFNLFYNGKLISSYAVHKQNFTGEDAIKVGEECVRRNKGIPILKQVQNFKLFCEMIYRRKIQRQSIRRTDHKLFTHCLLALMRLGVIENDDFNGFLICPRKKKRTTRRDRVSEARTTESRPTIHRRD